MSAEEFLKSKGNGESPYGEVIWNYNTASNEWLADLLEEYWLKKTQLMTKLRLSD